MRISGAVSFHELSMVDNEDCTVYLFADRPLSTANQCKDCSDETECQNVVDFVKKMSMPKDVFVEVSFIDKISLKGSEKSIIKKGLSKVSFDEKVIYNALNFVRAIARLPEVRPGLIGTVAKSFQKELFFKHMVHNPDKIQRFHYTDIRFEPILYNILQKLTIVYKGPIIALTDDSRKYIYKFVNTGKKFRQLILGFVKSDDIIDFLNKKFGAGLSKSLMSVFTWQAGGHKVKKSYDKCPEVYKHHVYNVFLQSLNEIQLKYAILFESKSDGRLNDTFDGDLYETWIAGFHLLTTLYTATRMLRYGSSESKNVCLIALESTVKGVRDMMVAAGCKTRQSIIGVSDSTASDFNNVSLISSYSIADKVKRTNMSSRISRCLFVDPM